MTRVKTDAQAARVVGLMIARYRQQQRKANGRPWSQMDLATAMGWSNPSTVCRIEQGQALPEQDTLLRMADALALGFAERKELLEQAGYGLSERRAVISKAEIKALRPSVEPLLASFDLPAAALDFAGTIIAWNEMAAALGSLPGIVLERWRGQNVVAILHTYARLLGKFVDNEEQLISHAARLLRTRFGPDLGSMPDATLAETLAAIPPDNGDAPLIIGGISVAGRHPIFGPLRFRAWPTAVNFDPRLRLVQLSPDDEPTFRLIAKLREQHYHPPTTNLQQS